MTHGRRRRLSRVQINRIFALVLTMAFAHSARAGEIFDFYTGVRQMGMGGAYTGVVNDETALLTNPAGLGKVRDATFTIVDPEFSIGSTDTNVASSSDINKVLDIQKLLDLLNNAKGTHWHLKGQVFPSIVGTNFGLGLHVKYSYDAEVDEDPVAGSGYRYDYTNDWAIPIGYCLRLFGGIVKIGTTFRLIDRTEVHKDLDSTATNLSLPGVASEGLGVGAYWFYGEY